MPNKNVAWPSGANNHVRRAPAGRATCQNPVAGSTGGWAATASGPCIHTPQRAYPGPRVRRSSDPVRALSEAGGRAGRYRTGAAANRLRGRPKGSGKRSQEALALVKQRPGITIAEIAATIGIKQNYLYQVLPQLAADGLVRKNGRRWHPNEIEAA